MYMEKNHNFHGFSNTFKLHLNTIKKQKSVSVCVCVCVCPRPRFDTS